MIEEYRPRPKQRRQGLSLQRLTMQLLWLSLLPLGALANQGLSGQPTNDTQALLWGPYRPNLYFGLRPRLPQSLMTGLMWFGTHDYQSISRQCLPNLAL